MDSLGKNSVYNVIYTVINTAFPLITAIYAARVILPENIGRVEYARNIVSYFTALAAHGLASYGIRETAKARDDRAETDKTFSELFIINFVSTSAALLLYIAFLFIFRVGDIPLYIACGAAIVFNYFSIDWFYRGREQYVYITLRSAAVKLVSLVMLIVFVRERTDYIVYAAILSLALGADHILNVLYAGKFVRLTFRQLDIKRHLRPLAVLAVTVFFASIYHKIDMSMLGSMSSESSVAYYSCAQKITGAAVTLCTAVSAAFFPRLSYCCKNDREQFERLLKTGTEAVIFITAPVTAGVFLLAPDGIRILFGDGFLPAAQTLRILTPMIPIMSCGNLLCYQLILCTGNEKKRLPAYILSSAGNIVLNLLLIPVFDRDGAAAASVAAELIVNGVQFLFIRKIVSIPAAKAALFQALFSSAAMAAVILPIKAADLPLAVSAAVCVLSGAAVYLLLNYMLGNRFLAECIGKLRGK